MFSRAGKTNIEKFLSLTLSPTYNSICLPDETSVTPTEIVIKLEHTNTVVTRVRQWIGDNYYWLPLFENGEESRQSIVFRGHKSNGVLDSVIFS